MKYLKLFESHINEAEVAKICDKWGINHWTLNSDGTVDVQGNVYLSNRELTKLPLKFGRVEGHFDLSHNELTSLEGSPQYVGDDFFCNNNKLTSLVGCPKYIGDSFYFSRNNIRLFEGIGYISNKFFCNNNPISVLWRLFLDASKIDMFNEWGVIQGDQVILYRLNYFLQEIGEDDVTKTQLNIIKKYYTII